MKTLSLLLGLFYVLLVLIIVADMMPGLALAVPQVVPDSGALQVVGNQVLKPDGGLYIPEGISVYGGLEDKDYAENLANVDAQIKAAAIYWHTNTIRLQVAESNLLSGLPKGQSYNARFLDELKREVALARSLKQAVVINDQTEFTNNTPAPTAMTVKFWRIMSQTFGNQPYIIFDLFNEPRLDSLTYGSAVGSGRFIRTLLARRHVRDHNKHHLKATGKDLIWHIWKYGGRVNGTQFVGMQTLVDQIRSRGVNNLIWAEGLFWGQHLPMSQYLLSGSNIVYSYHHINLNDSTDWKFIGQFSGSHPVVDGEWSQYQSPWQECYARAPVTVPHYLQYLKVHGIGLIAWSLQASSLLKGNPSIVPTNNNSPQDPRRSSALLAPSHFARPYRCNNQFGHGAGLLIKRYFIQNSTAL